MQPAVYNQRLKHTTKLIISILLELKIREMRKKRKSSKWFKQKNKMGAEDRHLLSIYCVLGAAFCISDIATLPSIIVLILMMRILRYRKISDFSLGEWQLRFQFKLDSSKTLLSKSKLPSCKHYTWNISLP